MRVSSTTTVFTLLTILVAAALVFRLAGFGLAWLPGAGLLAVLLAGLHLATAAARAPRPLEWRRFLSTNGFGIALGLAVVLSLIVRLPGLGADLGHTPLDIDESRLASSVKHFFDTGQLEHLTVEHYPGAVFWLFAFASFLHYLRDLTSGVEVAPSQLSISTFVLAARMANVFVAAATVAITGLIGRRLWGAGAGLLAAVLVAIVPLSVETTTLVRDNVLYVTGPQNLAWAIDAKTGKQIWRYRRELPPNLRSVWVPVHVLLDRSVGTRADSLESSPSFC